MHDEGKVGTALNGVTSERLLQAAAAGRVTALDALFGRHIPFLTRYARGRLPRWARTMADTADLVQDALLRTFQRLPRFESRGQGALRAYLRTAVDNRVRDEYRKIARRGVMDVLDDEAPASPLDSPFEEALGHETEARYRAALDRLKPTDRDLIVGYVELGYSHEQLAVMTGRRRTNAARVALTRALQRLAVEMDCD